MQRLCATRYSHARTFMSRVSLRSEPYARTNTSCSTSSASWREPAESIWRTYANSRWR